MGEYLVIGLGRFGRNLAVELQSLGHEVVAVDLNRELIQDISTEVRHAVAADATSEAVLREIAVASLDAAVVAMGEPEPSIMTTLLLKRLSVPYVIAKASSELHGEILKAVGADRVVFPEKEMAEKLAHGIAVPEIVDYLSISPDTGISKLATPRHLVGEAYGKVDLEGRFGLRLVAIIRRDRVLFGAAVGEVFEERDVLVMAGKDKDLRRFAAHDEG